MLGSTASLMPTRKSLCHPPPSWLQTRPRELSPTCLMVEPKSPQSRPFPSQGETLHTEWPERSFNTSKTQFNSARCGQSALSRGPGQSSRGKAPVLSADSGSGRTLRGWPPPGGTAASAHRPSGLAFAGRGSCRECGDLSTFMLLGRPPPLSAVRCPLSAARCPLSFSSIQSRWRPPGGAAALKHLPGHTALQLQQLRPALVFVRVGGVL